jgi:hypothetical protein
MHAPNIPHAPCMHCALCSFWYCLGFGARGSAHTPWARPSWAGPGCIQPVPGGVCGVSTAASGQARSGCVLSWSDIWVPRVQRRRVHPQPRCRFQGTPKTFTTYHKGSVPGTATLRCIMCRPSLPRSRALGAAASVGIGCPGRSPWCRIAPCGAVVVFLPLHQQPPWARVIRGLGAVCANCGRCWCRSVVGFCIDAGVVEVGESVSPLVLVPLYLARLLPAWWAVRVS